MLPHTIHHHHHHHQQQQQQQQQCLWSHFIYKDIHHLHLNEQHLRGYCNNLCKLLSISYQFATLRWIFPSKWEKYSWKHQELTRRQTQSTPSWLTAPVIVTHLGRGKKEASVKKEEKFLGHFVWFAGNAWDSSPKLPILSSSQIKIPHHCKRRTLVEGTLLVNDLNLLIALFLQMRKLYFSKLYFLKWGI